MPGCSVVRPIRRERSRTERRGTRETKERGSAREPGRPAIGGTVRSGAAVLRLIALLAFRNAHVGSDLPRAVALSFPNRYVASLFCDRLTFLLKFVTVLSSFVGEV